jgi:hypothetical protein
MRYQLLLPRPATRLSHLYGHSDGGRRLSYDEQILVTGILDVVEYK